MAPEFYITDKERELLEALVKEKTMTWAARSLGMSKSAASMRIRRLKDRRIKAESFLDEVGRYKKRLPSRFL